MLRRKRGPRPRPRSAHLSDGASLDALTVIGLEDGLCYLLELESITESAVRAAADAVDGVASATVDPETAGAS